MRPNRKAAAGGCPSKCCASEAGPCASPSQPKVKAEPMNTRGRSRLNKSGGEAQATLLSKPGGATTTAVWTEKCAPTTSEDKESKTQNIYKKPYPLSDARTGSGTRSTRKQNKPAACCASEALPSSGGGGESGDR